MEITREERLKRMALLLTDEQMKKLIQAITQITGGSDEKQ